MTSRGHIYISQTNSRNMVPSARACGPLLLLPLLVAATCKVQQPMPAKDGSGRLEPPSKYAAIWYEMETCSGRRGDIRAVAWYVVPTESGVSFECMDGACVGLYIPDEHAIYISDHRVASRQIVAHEILHALGLTHYDPQFWRCLREPMPDRFQKRR